VPEVIRPVVEAAQEGSETTNVVRAVIQSLGFDSFLYGLSLSPRPDREAQLYGYSTVPREWLATYDRRAYCEIDPRIPLVLESGGAHIWDQNTFRGRSKAVDEFLDSAAQYGTCSGVCFALHDVSHHGAMLAFNSRIPVVDRIRRQVIERNLSEILSFGHYFNSWFIRTVLDHDIAPTLHGASLSPREIEVLKLVARGLSTDDVAARMSVVARTVQLHLDSARAKLGAANRQQAVALAIKAGFVTVLA